MATEKGSISIHTENIFPIIKKFLYSDHEIFLRELVSNAVDATQKLKRLSAIGEYKGELGEDLKVSGRLYVARCLRSSTRSTADVGLHVLLTYEPEPRNVLWYQSQFAGYTDGVKAKPAK